MTVLCAIPVQIPVHRIRVRVQCLATGGPVHTAALRLADYWGESPEEIAEVLGLPIPRVEQLLADLANGGEPIERDFVLWVDHARESVLHYSALTGAAVKPERDGPLTLPADPPTPAALAQMGLDAPLSWDLGRRRPSRGARHNRRARRHPRPHPPPRAAPPRHAAAHQRQRHGEQELRVLPRPARSDRPPAHRLGARQPRRHPPNPHRDRRPRRDRDDDQRARRHRRPRPVADD